MRALKFLLLVLLGGVIFVLCLASGPVMISPLAIFQGAEAGDAYRILVALRIPRVIMAVLVGASLSVSGVIFQSLLRNPLAEPYTMGVSGGAALGAAVAVALSMNYSIMALFAFAGSITAVMLVYSLARLRGLGNTSLILAGVALSFMFSAGVLLIFSMIKAESVHQALMWLMGDLSIARYTVVMRMSMVFLVLLIFAMMHSRQLDVLSFGEEFAHGTGIVRSDVMRLFWLASLMAALTVALAGVIGFVGLIIPHIMRRFTGPRHGRLIPASAIGGAIFLMVADTLGRTLRPPFEIPAGIITGFFGGLFFFIILMRRGD